MTNIFDVHAKMISKIKDLTSINQIILDNFLEQFDEKTLKYPRIILKSTNTKDSEYYYSDLEYDISTQEMQNIRNRISTLYYDIDLVTNSTDNGLSLLELEKIRDHFNFQDGEDKLDNLESVTRHVSNIVSFKFSKFQYPDTINRLSIKIDVNNVSTKDVGYAETIKSELIINN